MCYCFLEYLAIGDIAMVKECYVRLDKEGHFVLPPEVMEGCNLKEGDFLILNLEGDTLKVKVSQENSEIVLPDAIFKTATRVAQNQGISVDEFVANGISQRLEELE